MADHFHVLVIAAQPKPGELLRRGLIYEGFAVDVRKDGASGLNAALEDPPDLIILEAELPGLDGYEVCRRLRAKGSVPVLMLIATDSVIDRVRGLDSGADDLMGKPFHFDEMIARLRALLRRSRSPAEGVLRFDDLTLYAATRQVKHGTRVINLSAKESDLLHVLMRHPRQVLAREVIQDRVWKRDFDCRSNVLGVYIRQLRSKLEAEGAPRLIHTVRGIGYVLREG